MTNQSTSTDCQHEDFDFHIEVARITNDEGGPVERFNVHLRMACKSCGIPFTFPGLPRGIDLDEPMAGAMGIEARLPARPLRDEDKRGETMRVVVPASAAVDDAAFSRWKAGEAS